MSDKGNLGSDTGVANGFEQQDLRTLVDEGKRIAGDSLRDAGRIYGDTLKNVTDLARKHPLESIAIGFGVGCLVGLVLARR